MSSSLTGVTLIRKGNELNYPWKECITSLSKLCDEVIVNADVDNSDGTVDELKGLSLLLPNIKIIYTSWDMSNTGDGRELAKQINDILPLVTTDWVVYMQADELIHEEDHVRVRDFITERSENVKQVELYRTYFYSDLQHRARQWEIWLGRIFRTGTHLVGGDGMYIVPVEKHTAIVRLPVFIYHYSRLGPEEKIQRKMKELDSLFHSEEVVSTIKPFKYDTEVQLDYYNGTHPEGIESFYGKF